MLWRQRQSCTPYWRISAAMLLPIVLVSKQSDIKVFFKLEKLSWLWLKCINFQKIQSIITFYVKFCNARLYFLCWNWCLFQCWNLCSVSVYIQDILDLCERKYRSATTRSVSESSGDDENSHWRAVVCQILSILKFLVSITEVVILCSDLENTESTKPLIYQIQDSKAMLQLLLSYP